MKWLALLLLVGCQPSEAAKEVSFEACFLAADARKIEAALTLCKGYTVDTCPEMPAIRAKHRKELVACYP